MIQRELTDEEVFGAAPAAPAIDPDTDALVRTVWGEARSEPPEGRKAVAAVIRNRAKLSGRTPREVVQEPGQFEPWGNPETRKSLEALDPASEDYQSILRDISGDDDPTFGATHFYAPKAQSALGRPAPDFDNGSGFDIGEHRFFRLPYEGKAPVADRELSDDEVFAGAQPEAAPATPSEDILGDVQFIGRPTSAGRKSEVVFADDQSPATPQQEAFYVGLVKAGKLDPAKVRAGEYRSGSEEFPALQRDPADLPKPGDWYLTAAGEKKQVPPAPWAPTVARAAVEALPMLGALKSFVPEDARFAAGRRALESGGLLGGRNEVLAALESLPKIGEGWGGVTKQFGDVLNREDRASGQARRDFPMVYDASATAGALASGAVIPAGAVPRIATGGASGFLATDGGLKERAAGAGLGIAGGEILARGLPVLAGKVAQAAGLPRRVGPEALAEAEAALKDLGGIRLEDLTPPARARLEAELGRGAVPKDAAVLALNESLPAPLPLKRGDVTGLPTDQLEFNMALRGARGAGSASSAQDLLASQQDRIRLNADRIAAGMSGSDAALARNDGGAKAAEALAARRAAMESGVNAKYDAARRGSGAAILPQYDMEPLAGGMVDAVTSGHALRDVPKVAGHLQDIQAMARKGDGQIKALYYVRARLSALRADGGAEAVAAGKAIKAFDAKMSDAMSADLLSGDAGAVKAWKGAIGARRELGEVFGQDDLADRLTSKTGSGSERRLTVDPGDAANYIFGRSALGAVGRGNLYRDLGKVRDILGPESEAWNALRSEAFVRIVGSGEGAMEGAVQQFSGAKFAKAWQKAKSEDDRLIGLLFTPEERSSIDAFAGVAARVTSAVKGGDNPSNTAAALKYLGRLSSSAFAVGKAVPLLREALLGVEEIANRAKTSRAMRPAPRTTPLPLRQLPARGGGYIAAEGVNGVRE